MKTQATRRNAKVTVEIRKCWKWSESEPTRFNGIVETARGRVFYCSWTRDEPPTEAEVLQVWKEERRAFQPGYGNS